MTSFNANHLTKVLPPQSFNYMNWEFIFSTGISMVHIQIITRGLSSSTWGNVLYGSCALAFGSQLGNTKPRHQVVAFPFPWVHGLVYLQLTSWKRETTLLPNWRSAGWLNFLKIFLIHTKRKARGKYKNNYKTRVKESSETQGCKWNHSWTAEEIWQVAEPWEQCLTWGVARGWTWKSDMIF